MLHVHSGFLSLPGQVSALLQTETSPACLAQPHQACRCQRLVEMRDVATQCRPASRKHRHHSRHSTDKSTLVQRADTASSLWDGPLLLNDLRERQEVSRQGCLRQRYEKAAAFVHPSKLPVWVRTCQSFAAHTAARRPGACTHPRLHFSNRAARACTPCACAAFKHHVHVPAGRQRQSPSSTA